MKQWVDLVVTGIISPQEQFAENCYIVVDETIIYTTLLLSLSPL